MIRAFLKAPYGKVGLGIIVGLIVVVIIGPLTLSGPASKVNFDIVSLSPSWGHLLGTDALGRDRMARLIVASRLSIVLSIEATLLGAGLGTSGARRPRSCRDGSVSSAYG
jgi:ABC-type dipeptide/oligopeptide/nickel transport system permease subunit